jgi:G3E family GTPase
MNAAARVHRTRDAQVEMDAILNQGGFNLSRAMTVDPQFLEPEYPFEWGGIFALDAGTHALDLAAGPDPAMGLVVLPVAGDTPAALDDAVMAAVLAYSGDEHAVGLGEVVTPGETLHTLDLSGGASAFRLQVLAPGFYAFFTEHHPDEFAMKTVVGDGTREPGTNRHFKPDHEHDEEVTSVGITTAGAVDVKKFNQWMGGLLQEQGQDLFRMKGILQLKGRDERYVFQGVHMLFDGRLDRPWGAETPRNSLIFIGRNLDRAALNAGFAKCLA